MGDLFGRLESEYCPPLDSALFAAIVSDYDVKIPQDLQNVRSILDELKDNALIEEAAGFDPSGTTEFNNGDPSHDKRSDSGSDAARSRSHETDLTSLSNGLSSVELDDSENAPDLFPSEDLEQLDFETKLALLEDIVGGQVSKYTIKHTLTKCNGKWHSAMEELLNHVYFADRVNNENDRPVANKGIEAFFKDDADTHNRKSKNKPKNRRIRPLDQSLASESTPSQSPATRNIWNSSTDDIEFIASRTRIATSTVSSAYHANGASVPKTLNALIKASMIESEQIVDDEKGVKAAAHELAQDFPTIAPSYILTIIRMTYPSTATAHSLAQALTTPPRQTPNSGTLQVIPQYTPIETLVSSPSASTYSPNVRTTYTSHDLSTTPSRRAANYSSMRATAFAQARAASRRARSDRLMSGAAAYYSEIAREHSALYTSASALAADDLVARQSNATETDLHGVDVTNAIRIARQNVAQWWSAGAEARGYGRLGAEARARGYRIIVGLGRHSEGGKGKLGPAVSKALREEGWKVEFVGAVVLVTGREK